MYLFFTVLCRAPSLHWSILNNELHLSGSRLYGMVLVYGMADSCLYNKQNNTWTLGDMEFIFECSHRYRTSERSEWVRYRMWTLEDKFHISARPCIILYLIANISEMLASIELKLHSMFIRFILNIFHKNWTKIKNVEFLVHLTFKIPYTYI